MPISGSNGEIRWAPRRHFNLWVGPDFGAQVDNHDHANCGRSSFRGVLQCVSVLGLYPHPNRALRGLPPLQPVALELVLLYSSRGDDSYHRRRQPAQESFLPAQVLPRVIVISAFVNFLLSLPLLFGLLLFFGVTFGWALLALPLIMAAQFALTLGLTLIVSSVSV
jgi:hypothetical protein